MSGFRFHLIIEAKADKSAISNPIFEASLVTSLLIGFTIHAPSMHSVPKEIDTRSKEINNTHSKTESAIYPERRAGRSVFLTGIF